MLEAGLDAYLVPHGDEFQNEYLPPHAERLAWLTGFTGSAGFCIVTQDSAVLFVDGRYTLQASRQADESVFTIEDLVQAPPSDWLKRNVGVNSHIGFDPLLITIRQKENFEKSIESSRSQLVPGANLVDEIWADQPRPPMGKVTVHPLVHAGLSADEKLSGLEDAMAGEHAETCLLTDPASLAWTFNIRGNDVAHTPVVLGFAILRTGNKPIFFIELRKLDNVSREHLEAVAKIEPIIRLEAVLAELARGRAVLCDPERVASRFADIIEEAGGEVRLFRDPAVLQRAVKNDAEIAGAHSAQLRDGVAVSRFLAWLDSRKAGSVDEIGAARKLEEMRRKTASRMNSELREISFDTISGAGANGAIVHYRVTEQTNASLAAGSLYLVDSGGQYEDGTTDITRTVAIGKPPEGAAEDFTLVLKGHIAIATARFPEKTRGVDLDGLARIDLWRRGKDYGHGTGHGVGAYLSVHEGPQAISRRAMEPLLAGMILSNEPGFYRAGKYGIRIENLVLVKPAERVPGGNIPVHELETLTLAPIDRRLIVPSLMTADEIGWLDNYHERVRNELSPWLNDADRRWLEKATLPLV